MQVAETAPPPIRAGGSGHLREILRRPGFRRLLAVRLPSHFADGLFQAALGGSVLFNPERASTALGVAMAFAVLYLPYSLVGPFVGVFLDRWSRRQILFLANAARAVLVLPVATLIWFGVDGPLFVLSALVVVAINRFFLNGLSASLPHVVENDQIVTANSFATTFGTVCYSTGLGVSTVLFHELKPGNHEYAILCAASVLGYALSSACARGLFRVDALGPDSVRPPHGVWAGIVDTARGMAAGLRHINSRPVARTLMLVQAAHRTLYGLLFIAMLLLYRNYFNHGTRDIGHTLAGLGVLLAVGAAGVLVGALITPRVARAIGGWHWITYLMAALALVIPVFGLPFTAPMLLVAAFLVNIATQATKIVVDSALQLECDDDFQGRVFSVNDTAFNLSFVAGIFIGAVALPPDGHAPPALAVVGVAYGLVALWLALSPAKPRTRRAEIH